MFAPLQFNHVHYNTVFIHYQFYQIQPLIFIYLSWSAESQLQVCHCRLTKILTEKYRGFSQSLVSSNFWLITRCTVAKIVFTNKAWWSSTTRIWACMQGNRYDPGWPADGNDHTYFLGFWLYNYETLCSTFPILFK